MRMLTLATLGGLVAMNLPLPSPAAVANLPVGTMTQPATGLSVMTYNVEGLPFPAAFGRAEKLAEIGKRLADLRRGAQQPDVILLQEAFIPEAKAIAAAAGYTHVAIGPRVSDAAPGTDNAFSADASWLKGERVGKWVDSGLVILSDYPIVQTRRMAFPDDMCAGYDCLAAKGVLLTWIKVPGRERPIAIADTHLNSRGASGVAIERANTAYARQVATLRDFIRANVSPQSDLVFGGDFNIGHDRQRIAQEAADGGIVNAGNEATKSAVIAGGRDAVPVAIITRGKDKQYFRAGTSSSFTLRNIRVPFATPQSGSTLSDHLGYVADYQF
ncbi:MULTISPECIES: endonuclease/exonuclease/phosphatase family protein [unclassified Novosphingobium]|uniref:endonuclease/exonuclease/phosphatase family protein n=1 Tax=unclassified Novosphingobium TaxID=2644732 RepID=UPI00190F5A70|nr:MULTISPECIES: endonuclease/exonuclease/phosphatase family protein [unclassified Novosphingobium]